MQDYFENAKSLHTFLDIIRDAGLNIIFLSTGDLYTLSFSSKYLEISLDSISAPELQGGLGSRYIFTLSKI